MRKALSARLGFLVLAAGAAIAAAPAAFLDQSAAPAASVLFTPLDERSATFSPDGRLIVFTVRIADYRQVLAVSRLGPNGWSLPSVAPFSGTSLDGDPAFSVDGKRLYFASDRGPGHSHKDTDIWQVDRTSSGWGEAVPVPGLVNSPGSEAGPAPAASGRLYFSSGRSGSGDIYVAEPGPAGFFEPKRLGAQINSDQPEATPAVDPSETLLVFASMGRPDQPLAPGVPYPKYDLYVSHRSAAGWSKATRLGPAVNTLATEAAPRFSRDGRSLIFMSERSRAANHGVLLTPTALHRMLA